MWNTFGLAIISANVLWVFSWLLALGFDALFVADFDANFDALFVVESLYICQFV